MCKDSKEITKSSSLDEKRSLLQENNNIPSYSHQQSQSNEMKSFAKRRGHLQKEWPSSRKNPLNVLNQTSSLAAFIGLAYCCFLVAKGDYYKWGMPLLISACICKLLMTAPRGGGYDNRKLQLKKKQERGRNEGYYSLNYESRSRGARIIPTCYSRAKSCLQQSRTIQILGNIYQNLKRRLNNDNHYNVIFLSAIIVIIPCFTYFVTKILGHLLDFKSAGKGINHEKLANDFGKLGSAAFSFLLIPVSKHSSLLAALNLGEVHMIRLHIAAGCVVLFGGIFHGLYYTYIWIELKGYNYQDVFPMKQCWSGLWARDYNNDCHEKLVNLLGIICGISLVMLGASSLYWVRRKFYRVFYVLHIVVSIFVLFGLVMHYNKMIWYMAPSLLYYFASNIPIHIESLSKWWRQQRSSGEGVAVSKIVCISDSGGCVELSFCIKNGPEVALDGTATEDEVIELGDDASSSMQSSFHNTVGKYIMLHVPEISAHSHPFTLFTNPHNPDKLVSVLFRPCGSFTTSLSKRLKVLTMLPEMTPSEIENHHELTMSHSSNNGLQSREKSCPRMLINGIRNATGDMFEHVMSHHDRVVIIAGGVGIVSYISLIHAIRLQQSMMIAEANSSSSNNNVINGNNGDVMESVINNHRRAMNFDDDETDEEVNGLEEGANGVISSPVSSSLSKRIDIHWMSRDEGLIQHVLQNYFEPFCNMPSESICMGMPSINIVVHHTSPHSNLSSPSHNSHSSSDEPSTWEPSRQQQQEATNDRNLHSSSPAFAFIASAYQGNNSRPSQNIIPSVAYASIVFGGLWIVNYCYNNLQSKHVVETRLISVLGIVLLSIAVSVASNATILGSQALYSKLCHFKYSKLKSSGSAIALQEEQNGDGEIEVGEVLQQQLETSGSDDKTAYISKGSSLQYLESNSQSPSEARGGGEDGCHAIMSISHSQGRPDMLAIVQDAITKISEEEHQQQEFDIDESSSCFRRGDYNSTDVGIFMCGPKAMSNSVWNAIKQQHREEEEEARSLCRGACTNGMCSSGRKPVAVYQEVFEL